MNLLKPYHAQFFLCACLVFIFYSATTSRDLAEISFSSDKLNHFVAFFVLSLLTDLAYPKNTIKFKAISLFLYGLIIECVQWQLPYRSFSLLDLAADSGGILIYWSAWKLWQTFNPLSQNDRL